MSDTSHRKPALYLAEFDSTKSVLHAAEKLRDAGYKAFDTHTPFPVHGMDAAMGLSDSKLGFIVFTGGATGTTIAFTMMYWMNGIDYPLIIGGKPPFSIPSMIPIMFELTVLLSAFSAVFGMFHLNRIPRHHHPVFNSERFQRVTDDRFFVSVDASDPKFDLEKTKKLLASAHASHLEVIYDDDTAAEVVELAGAH